MLRSTTATLATILFLTAPAAAGPKPENPRQVVEAYVAASLAGKPDDAAALGAEGTSPAKAKSAEKVKSVVGKEKLAIATVTASETGGYALAVTGGFKAANPRPERPEAGCLVFTLTKTRDGWRVKYIDFRSEEEAKKQLEAVPGLYPDAKEIPATKPA
jgi:hypothetical protein